MFSMYNAQTVIANKFWIVNGAYGKVGTLRLCDNGQYEFYNQTTEEKQYFDSMGDMFKVSAKSTETVENVLVEGLPTGSTVAFPTNELEYPAFRKTKNGKTLHAAGYWIIQFTGSAGWQWALAPKVETLGKYIHKGPFVTEWEATLEMKKSKRGTLHELQQDKYPDPVGRS